MKFITAFILALFLHPVFSQTLTVSQKDSAIAGIKKLISEKYAVPHKAKAIADSLQSKNYSNITSWNKFVKKVNEDLYRYSQDKHLSLQYDSALANKLAGQMDFHKEQNDIQKRENYGVSKVELLDGNIGYLKLDYFADGKSASDTVLNAIRFLSKTFTLIIDLRDNTGGSGSMVQLLASVFLPNVDTELLRILYRTGDTVNLKTQRIEPEFQYLSRPVYILCNNKTYSAAEAFTFIFKNKKRAIVIGETTAGAGNIAGPYSVNNKFVITIPVGTIADPLTNTGWEQKGVTPDINSNSENALDKTLQLLRNKSVGE